MSVPNLYHAKANSPSTILNRAVNSTDTVIYLLDVSVLPLAPNILVIGYDTLNPETVLYQGISGNTITDVIRGFEGTPQNFGIGTNCSRVFTAYDYNALIENIKSQKLLSIAMSIVL